MGIHAVPTDFYTTAEVVQLNRESRSSGVAWGAVFGGAFVSAALYLILLALGAGFELSAISPWSGNSFSSSAIGATAILWLIVSEIIASGIGGYLTGRLRTKWASVHDEEVFFRDTANGFLSWAVALVASAAFLATAAVSMTGGASFDDSSQASIADPVMYSTDTLFRTDRGSQDAGNIVLKTEAARIFARSLREESMTTADQSYLARIVSSSANLSQADASRRVADVFSEARRLEVTERKATAHFLLWLFVSLLLGAFSASFAATVGGKQRDHARSL